MLGITPSQTIGPFFAFNLTSRQPGRNYPWKQIATNNLFPADAVGQRITVKGRASAGDDWLCYLTLLECWQANADGNYAKPSNAPTTRSAFDGFGRVEADEAGCFSFNTIMPGIVEENGTRYAPHINIALFSPCLLSHLCTRIYFEDHPLNDQDPILNLVPVDRRKTLIARRDDDNTYVIDFLLRGKNETVFFSY